MAGITILGCGMYIPSDLATNEDFARFVDTSDEWITTRTGIKTRHMANGILTYQMGTEAAKQALREAGVTADQIDLVIGTTVTGDFLTPSMSCMVAGELGMTEVPCMDLNAACAGFVYALDVAQKYLASGDVKRILIVSSEMVTRMVDYTDRSTCVLFGDGAGAMVVAKGEGGFATYISGDPSGAEKIFTKLPMSDSPFRTKTPQWKNPLMQDYPLGLMYMDGNDVYKFAVSAMPRAVEIAAKRLGITADQLDLIVPHQANIRIVQTAMKKLGLPMERCYCNIDEYGNTSSACIPVCLHELRQAGRLKSGMKICLVGFGAGLVYGAAAFEIC